MILKGALIFWRPFSVPGYAFFLVGTPESCAVNETFDLDFGVKLGLEVLFATSIVAFPMPMKVVSADHFLFDLSFSCRDTCILAASHEVNEISILILVSERPRSPTFDLDVGRNTASNSTFNLLLHSSWKIVSSFNTICRAEAAPTTQLYRERWCCMLW